MPRDVEVKQLQTSRRRILLLAVGLCLLAYLTVFGVPFSKSTPPRLDTSSPLQDATSKAEPTQPSTAEDEIKSPPPVLRSPWLDRQEAVRNAFVHAWNGYRRQAFGHDEVRPKSNSSNDSWGGFGVTLIDGLDTMMLMGLDKQASEARDFITKVDFDKDYEASFFESTIRYVGGLLGAYELTEDPVYLEKAGALSRRLGQAFGTPLGQPEQQTGGLHLPQGIVNLHSGSARNPRWTGGSAILAEIGSVQLEFSALARADPTPENKHLAEQARHVFSTLHKAPQEKRGLYPVYVDPARGVFTSGRVTIGSLADSFYEYQLKLYLLSGYEDLEALEMFIESTQAVHEHLLKRVKAPEGQDVDEHLPWYLIGELSGSRFLGVQEHLTCFWGGVLGLAHITASKLKLLGRPLRPVEEKLIELAPGWLEIGEAFTRTCAFTYFLTPTGLGPESVVFAPEGAPSARIERGWLSDQTKYILRPETVESLFVMFRATGNEVYRAWGWRIFEALEKYCRTPVAYSGLKDVEAPPSMSISDNWDDSMPSFFLAETLKYLYLLFGPTSDLPLDQFVFNTEAHPLRYSAR